MLHHSGRPDSLGHALIRQPHALCLPHFRRDESILMRMLHVRAVLQKDMFVLFNAESRAVQDVAADVAKKAAEMEEHPTDWEVCSGALWPVFIPRARALSSYILLLLEFR